ncbi:MAG: FkbM family methyltransferase [Blastocatellia bacterium]
MSDQITIAESDKCREQTLIETIGANVSRKMRGSPLRTWLKSAYHAALNLQTGGKGLKCMLPEGESVRILPAYRYVSWNLDEYRAFKSNLKAGHIVFDVGANVGCYSLLFGQWVGSSGKVYAFEPSPETFAALSRHVALNSLEDVLLPVNTAISDESSSVDFLALDTLGMSRMLVQNEQAEASQVIRVPAISIDEFCARERVLPDLIKIDVEGFELSVLRGARETIRDCRSRLALFVEMHPTTWREIGLSKADIIDELDAQNLRAVPLRPCEDMWAIEGECLRLVAK